MNVCLCEATSLIFWTNLSWMRCWSSFRIEFSTSGTSCQARLFVLLLLRWYPVLDAWILGEIKQEWRTFEASIFPWDFYWYSKILRKNYWKKNTKSSNCRPMEWGLRKNNMIWTLVVISNKQMNKILQCWRRRYRVSRNQRINKIIRKWHQLEQKTIFPHFFLRIRIFLNYFEH